MIRQTDDVRARAVPGPVLPRAFDRVGNGLEKGIHGHGARKPKRRIENLENSSPVFKHAGLIARERPALRTNSFHERLHTCPSRAAERGLQSCNLQRYSSLTNVGLTTPARDPVNAAFAEKWALLLITARHSRPPARALAGRLSIAPGPSRFLADAEESLSLEEN